MGYVLKKFPRLSETFILNEVLGLEEHGVEVTVFSHRPPDEEVRHAELALLRAGVVQLPLFGSTATLQAFAALALHGGENREALKRALDFVELLPEARRAELLVQGIHLARAAREKGIDHLHAHFMTVAAHLAHVAWIFTGLPYSVTAHAKDIYRHTVDAALFRRVAEAASTIVTVCDANQRFIREQILPGSPAPVHRLYNGLPLDEVQQGSEPRETGLILGVGRLVEKKGFHLLLEACRILKDRGVPFSSVLVGEGEERARLEAGRDRLGLSDRVRFTGALSRAETLEWMRRAWVLAAPCITGKDGNQDALPTVLIEALALGLPSVSTPVGGILEIVDDGVHGLIVPEGDPLTLAGALQRILQDEVLWKKLSAAGRPRAESRFDRRRTLPELVAVFSGRRRWVQA